MTWCRWNPNPSGRNVGDCAVRAVAKALNISWDTAYVTICNEGFRLTDMPSSNAVWGSVLKRNGFQRYAVPNNCPDCYTAEDFCRDHQHGVFVLCFGSHVATADSGTLFDSWDSSREIVQYYWSKEED